MRFVVVLAALAGLLGIAGTASAQSFGPRCPQACPSCVPPCSKYSGYCHYPACQRPMPQDPWAGRGQAKQGEGFQWHPYLRSPRDFWMVQP